MTLITSRSVPGRLITGVLGLCAAAAAMLPIAAKGQDTYPSRTITLVVPFPAGSGSDMSARL